MSVCIHVACMLCGCVLTQSVFMCSQIQTCCLRVLVLYLCTQPRRHTSIQQFAPRARTYLHTRHCCVRSNQRNRQNVHYVHNMHTHTHTCISSRHIQTCIRALSQLHYIHKYTDTKGRTQRGERCKARQLQGRAR